MSGGNHTRVGFRHKPSVKEKTPRFIYYM